MREEEDGPGERARAGSERVELACGAGLQRGGVTREGGWASAGTGRAGWKRPRAELGRCGLGRGVFVGLG